VLWQKNVLILKKEREDNRLDLSVLPIFHPPFQTYFKCLNKSWNAKIKGLNIVRTAYWSEHYSWKLSYPVVEKQMFCWSRKDLLMGHSHVWMLAFSVTCIFLSLLRSRLRNMGKNLLTCASHPYINLIFMSVPVLEANITTWQYIQIQSLESFSVFPKCLLYGSQISNDLIFICFCKTQ